MWNFFSRESFPYEIGDKVDSFTGISVFSLSNGVKKSNGDKVSVFSYNKKNGSEDFLEHAQNAVKKLKTLKHPSILTFIDSYEDESYIHIVTNHCTPLLEYLKNLDKVQVKEMYLKWGLATIAEAVSFLNKADLRHNHIFHGSIFVNDHGFWQLGEVGYITNLKSKYPHKLIEKLRKYEPPKDMLNSSVRFVDCWGLGILVWESFNGELNCSTSSFKPKGISPDLVSIFHQLVQKKQNNKETVHSFINSCTSKNLLFSTLEALNNYHLKDKDVKAKVCKDLLTLLPEIPKDIVLNIILSSLKQAYGFDSDNSAYFVPIVAKLPSIATEEKYLREVEQFLTQLFSSNDRATRLSLLINIEEFINEVSKKSVDDMFPYLSAGFLDSNPKIRGETVKAMVFIATKLSKKNLNDESMRLLLQIQSKDPETYIRANTTICLGKIAHSLQPNTRKKILLNAFLYALRDPCTSVRNAGIQAFAVTHRFFPIEETAKKILPGLVYLTIDDDSNVRENAFKTIKILLSKIEQVSQSPDMKEEMEKYVMIEACEENLSWSNWAFAAITSKFLKTLDVKTKPDINENKNTSDSLPTTSDLSEKKVTDICSSLDMNPSGESESSDYEGWSDGKFDNWSDVSEVKSNTVQKNKEDDGPKKSTGPMKLGTRVK